MFKQNPEHGLNELKLFKEATNAFGVGSVRRVICAPADAVL